MCRPFYSHHNAHHRRPEDTKDRRIDQAFMVFVPSTKNCPNSPHLESWSVEIWGRSGTIALLKPTWASVTKRAHNFLCPPKTKPADVIFSTTDLPESRSPVALQSNAPSLFIQSTFLSDSAIPNERDALFLVFWACLQGKMILRTPQFEEINREDHDDYGYSPRNWLHVSHDWQKIASKIRSSTVKSRKLFVTHKEITVSSGVYKICLRPTSRQSYQRAEYRRKVTGLVFHDTYAKR